MSVTLIGPDNVQSVVDINEDATVRDVEEIMAATSAAVPYRAVAQSVPNGVVVLAGRVFFSLIFILAGPYHFSQQTIAFAASQGVPLASIAVPSGVIAVVVDSFVWCLSQTAGNPEKPEARI